ncbi:large-conductance mechanosensitive channel protein MscL [Aestuariivivens insulae]|uniref:large-conductance mechanosensitive channel protein MscL n=1 Tax=Aestuariivivens insulae TaxID=1621988 RepID=UPI001F58A9BD|nr:large-conductance mechanosensitive channel protein MscL [Aestuariivivens insulae]
MLKEFKEFAIKGNLVDIAIGFVMGAAFKQVVTSFTGGIVSPLIGLIFKADFKDLKLELKEAVVDATGQVTTDAVFLEYGTFLTHVIDFLIVAFVMFMVVKGVNKMKKKEEPAPEAPKGPSQEELLAEIRDLLKK